MILHKPKNIITLYITFFTLTTSVIFTKKNYDTLECTGSLLVVHITAGNHTDLFSLYILSSLKQQ